MATRPAEATRHIAEQAAHVEHLVVKAEVVRRDQVEACFLLLPPIRAPQFRARGEQRLLREFAFPIGLGGALEFTLLADARTTIEAFEEKVGPVLTDDEREADIDTLGGLVMSLTDRVPSRGELVTHSSGIVFEVLDADPRRIKRLRVRDIPARSSPDKD